MRNIAKRAPFAFTSLDLSFLGAGLLAAVLAVILYLLGDLNVLAAGFLGVVIGSLPASIYGAHQHWIHGVEASAKLEERLDNLAPLIRSAYSLGMSIPFVSSVPNSEFAESVRQREVIDAEVLGVKDALVRMQDNVEWAKPRDLVSILLNTRGVEVAEAFCFGLDALVFFMAVTQGKPEEIDAEAVFSLKLTLFNLLVRLKDFIVLGNVLAILECWAQEPTSELLTDLMLLILEYVGHYREGAFLGIRDLLGESFDIDNGTVLTLRVAELVAKIPGVIGAPKFLDMLSDE